MAPSALWDARLASSRLLEYEVMNRVNSSEALARHAPLARAWIDRVALYEMSPQVLARALRPLPAPLRTLDALHLATMHFLRAEGLSVTLASFDKRLVAAAAVSGFDAEPL